MLKTKNNEENSFCNSICLNKIAHFGQIRYVGGSKY